MKIKPKHVRSTIVFLSQLGASMVVGAALKPYIQVARNPIIKGIAYLGVIGLSYAASDAAAKAMTKQIDEVCTAYDIDMK